MFKGEKPQMYLDKGTRPPNNKSEAEVPHTSKTNRNGKTRKRVKRRKNDTDDMEVVNAYNVPTKNRFHSLSESDGDDKDDVVEEEEEEDTASSTVKKDCLPPTRVKIPPIVLYAYIAQHTRTLNSLRQ